jgi:hypothetical protein
MNKEVDYKQDGYEKFKEKERELQARILKLLRLMAEACPAEKKE